MINRSAFTLAESEAIRARVPEIRRRLLANLRSFPGVETPLLIAGDGYDGIWLEHNQDNWFLADYAPESAWAAQEIFMRHQRPDGLLPAALRLDGRVGYRQLQSVWPFARCALEIAKKLKRPESDFAAVYRAGAAYDDFLWRFRDHTGAGVVEMFCEYDTGHDQSPRASGLPHQCTPDAAAMPKLSDLPIIAPDLSAMRGEGRAALAELAGLLGRDAEAQSWRDKAEATRTAIRKLLRDPGDGYYYDLGSAGFRRYRSEHLTRLFLNRTVEQSEFDRLYRDYFENPAEFLSNYPFPSMALSDPAFVTSLPRNCWGGNTQALTSLRALLWLEYYRKPEEKRALLRRWMRAFLDFSSRFPQELDPFTGSPIGGGENYTPTLLLYLEGAAILA